MVSHLYQHERLGGQAIAIRLGVSWPTVYRTLHRLGIPVRNRMQLAEAQDLEAEKLYVEQRLSTNKIAHKFGCHPTAVIHALRRRGVTRRNNSDCQKRLSPEEEHKVCLLYQEGMNSNALSMAFRVNGQTILNTLARHSIAARSYAESGRRWKFNERFFDNIATEQQAYWLGFIAADGGITRNTLTIDLAIKDITHLELFRQAIESDRPIRTYRANTYARLCLNSQRLIADLLAHGIGERKSLTIGKITGIPDPLLRHFFRGYCDGDGYIGKPVWGWCVTIVGTKTFLQWMLDFTKRTVKTNTSVRPSATIFQVEFGGNRLAPQVASLLYGGSAVSLQRKQSLYATMMEERTLSTPSAPNSIQPRE